MLGLFTGDRGSGIVLRVAAIAPRPWLEHLRVHLDALRVEITPAAVHQLRVALARLRVWGLLADREDLAPELRWLRRAAAAVRDLDVRLSMPGIPPRLSAQLRGERRRAAAVLGRVVRGRRAEALVSALDGLGDARRKPAERRLRRLAARALARGDRGFVDDRDREHALRRAIRRVRFGLEWLGEECPPLVELQSALGEVNDRAMALAGAAGRGARLVAHRAALAEDLVAAERHATEAWPHVRRLLAVHAASR